MRHHHGFYSKEAKEALKRHDSRLEDIIKTLKENNMYEDSTSIEAIFTSDEAKELGADPRCALMLEANKGYYFLDHLEGEIIREIQPNEAGVVHDVTSSTHGYSPFKEDYTTVFMAAGCGIKKGAVIEKMNLIDEAPTMAKLLGLELKNVDGRIVEEIFE